MGNMCAENAASLSLSAPPPILSPEHVQLFKFMTKRTHILFFRYVSRDGGRKGGSKNELTVMSICDNNICELC